MNEREPVKLIDAIRIFVTLMALAFVANDAVAETKLWAFRGGQGVGPENTIEGMNIAFEFGASGTEIDLWQIQRESGGINTDPEIILLHDLSVDRTTNGTGLVHDLTFEYVRSLDAGQGNSVGAQVPGAQVPTLSEALTTIKQQNKDVLLHIKPDLFGFGTRAPLAAIAADLAEVEFPEDKIFAWTPFETDVIDYVAGIPDVRVIFQGDLNPANVNWEHLIDIGVSGIQIPMDWQRPGSGNFTQQYVDDIQANGLLAFVTDPRPEEVSQAIEFGVDIVMTRKVHRYAPILAADFNLDDRIDFADTNFYSGTLGMEATGDLSRLDLDDDGIITLADHDIHVTTYARTADGQYGAPLGDINLDGDVDISQFDGSQNVGDASVFLANLGATQNATYAQGDFNADGDVDISQIVLDASGVRNVGDASRLLANLGQPFSSPSFVVTTAVPEPSSVPALAVAAVSACFPRRRIRKGCKKREPERHSFSTIAHL